MRGAAAALLVLSGVLLGEAVVWAERVGMTENWRGGWIYTGGVSPEHGRC
jgi:hypothetical protein